MNNFIEDYLYNPAQAIASARERVDRRFSNVQYNEEQIYNELASPEFHLYEAVVMSDANENTPHTGIYAVVA